MKKRSLRRIISAGTIINILGLPVHLTNNTEIECDEEILRHLYRRGVEKYFKKENPETIEMTANIISQETFEDSRKNLQDKTTEIERII